MKHTVYQSRPP